MSKLKALILDAGGVLVRPKDGNWNIPARYRELLGDYALDIPSEKWLEACRAESDVLREDCFVNGISAEYELKLCFMKNIAVRMGWNLPFDSIVALAQDFTYNFDRYLWYDDVELWLGSWHDRYKLGVLSDAMPSFRSVMEDAHCMEYLDALVISTKVGAAKPDAKMYHTICAQLNAAPEETLFVDDRAGNLLGAIRCGIHAVQMCRDDLEPWNGSYVRNLEELNAYMEGLF